jgi:hypothetical protein
MIRRLEKEQLENQQADVRGEFSADDFIFATLPDGTPALVGDVVTIGPSQLAECKSRLVI